jgi:hypothetical protein
MKGVALRRNATPLHFPVREFNYSGLFFALFVMALPSGVTPHKETPRNHVSFS